MHMPCAAARCVDRRRFTASPRFHYGASRIESRFETAVRRASALVRARSGLWCSEARRTFAAAARRFALSASLAPRTCAARNRPARRGRAARQGPCNHLPKRADHTKKLPTAEPLPLKRKADSLAPPIVGAHSLRVSIGGRRAALRSDTSIESKSIIHPRWFIKLCLSFQVLGEISVRDLKEFSWASRWFDNCNRENGWGLEGGRIDGPGGYSDNKNSEEILVLVDLEMLVKESLFHLCSASAAVGDRAKIQILHLCMCAGK